MINLEELTIGQVKEINTFTNNQQTKSASIYKDLTGNGSVATMATAQATVMAPAMTS